MKRRVAGLLVLGGLLFSAEVAQSEGVTIDHKAVDCIVAGKYSKFDACFDPASNLAKGRVYFRAAGGPFWYFVDMKPEATCFSGVLPKVKKSTPKINYYVEGVDKSFAESRTAEFDPIVVGSAEECKKKVAGVPPGSPSVVVGAPAGAPAVPAGFAAAGGGAGLVTAAAIVGGAAATGGIIAATKTSSNPTTTPVTAPPATTPQTTPATTPPSTLGPGSLSPDFRVNPDPPVGLAPLTVTFNMCHSSDSNNAPLTYSYDFGDGSSTGTVAFCRTDHVYKFTASGQVIDLKTLESKICVSNGPQTACHKFTINPACGDITSPTVQIVSPSNGFFGSCSIPVTANADDADGFVAQVEFFVQPKICCGPPGPTTKFGTSRTAPYTATYMPPQFTSGQATLTARATDGCGNVAFSPAVVIRFDTYCCTCLASVNTRSLKWVSELHSKGAAGQVILNGQGVSYASSGRSYANGKGFVGENRIEAKLSAGGDAGTWRFELVANESVVPGSLRVVAGEVAEVTANAIVFQIKGTPGERVVFTFKTR